MNGQLAPLVPELSLFALAVLVLLAGLIRPGRAIGWIAFVGLLVIFGVLAGGEIAGIAGMFLSVPVIAAARIVWRRLRARESAPVDDRELAQPGGPRSTTQVA